MINKWKHQWRDVHSGNFVSRTSQASATMAGEGLTSYKAVIISSALLVGSGAAFIMYQHYIWSKKQRCLSAQIVQLKQQILKLENDIKQIKEAAAASSSTDEMEEIFVDASEVAQEM